MSESVQSGADWGVVGAADAVTTLQRMLAADRVPHALLITGPPQVGKSRVALGLARALNCDAASGRPCERCRACERIAAGKHADVEVVAPGGLCRVAEHDHSRSRSIGICAVRRLEMTAAMQPYEGRQRVFIVDPADALTEEAADAFLKTLEEPPAAVTFLLVTSRPALLPETVRSRCRALTVAPLAVADLAAWLAAERELPEEQANMLARMGRGRLGWVLSALAEGDPLALRRAQTEEIRRLAAAGRAERFAHAETLAGRGADPQNALTALAHWTDWWRDILLVAAGSDDRILHRDQRAELEAEARRYRAADVCRYLMQLQRTTELLQQGVSARLALQVLLLQTPVPQEGEPVEPGGARPTQAGG
ncbi:MAG: DNA polymerase III subunit delta' [Dehalococcoidia bacterium]